MVRFTPDEGISQSTIYSIVEDRQGLIWISTANGVNRYDGVGFSDIPVLKNPVKKPNAPQGRMVTDIMGNIWIGGIPGLYRADVKKAAFENLDYLVGNQVLANTVVYCSLGPEVWFSGDNNRLLAYNVLTKQLRKYELKGIVPLTQTMIVVKVSGKYILCISQSHVYLIDRNGEKLLRKIELPSRNITDVCELAPDYWIAGFQDHKPLSIYAKNVTIPGGSLGDIEKITNIECFLKTANELFVGCVDGKLHHFEISKKGKIISLADVGYAPVVFDNFRIIALTLDKNRQLWAGTDGGGLFKLNLSSFRFGHLGGKSDLAKPEKSTFVRSFFEDKYGRLWVGYYRGGIQMYDRNFHGIKDGVALLKELEDASVTAIYKDAAGVVWIASGKGIFQTNEELGFLKRTFAKQRKEDTELQVNCFLETGAGKLLMATTIGLFEYKRAKDSWECIYSSGTNLLTAFTDASDRLWTSHYWTYLIISPPEFPMSERTWIKALLPSLNSRHVVYDAKREVYVVATEGGVKVLNKKLQEIASYAMKEGLSNPFVYGILIDKTGNYWVSTNNGINCIDPETKKVLRYGLADGIQSREFNSGAFLKLKSGYFVFGGINGFNYFKPEFILEKKQANDLVLTEAWFSNESSGEKIAYTDVGMRLFAGINFVEVGFSLTDFTSPGNIRYYYRLNNNRWIALGNKNHILFSNLAPGNYTLLLRAEDHNGNPVKEKRLMHFVILAPFYRTWWFFVLMLFLAGVVVFAVTRYLYTQRLKVALAESNRIKEIQSLRMNISRELHDNLGASLSRVSLLTHKLREMPEKTDMQSAVASISKLASEMNGQVRNIVWSIDNNYDNLESLRTYMRQFTSTFLEENHIESDIRFNDALPDLALGPDIRQALFSVLKESLNNAVKHSASGKIEVQFCTEESGAFQLCIRDFGKGFDPNHQKPFSHGLRNIRQRLEELGFACAIQAGLGEGCEIRISGQFNIPH